ncbi:MAG TPA: PIN domain-containing protein [Acidimicrobiales bacterium]|nr:PIN domain-containing protein [Acidimicrobiales bacterium]
MALSGVPDANVLYPIALADFFLTTAGLGLFRAHWSPELLDEVGRNLAKTRTDLAPEQISYRLAEMDAALPGASAEPPKALVAKMHDEAKDRHVLALAVHVEAAFVVTFNLTDFPPEACAPHDIEAEHPDGFATRLVVDSGKTVMAAIQEMAGRRSRPPASPEDIIEHLARSLPLAIESFNRPNCDDAIRSRAESGRVTGRVTARHPVDGRHPVDSWRDRTVGQQRRAPWVLAGASEDSVGLAAGAGWESLESSHQRPGRHPIETTPPELPDLIRLLNGAGHRCRRSPWPAGARPLRLTR